MLVVSMPAHLRNVMICSLTAFVPAQCILKNDPSCDSGWYTQHGCQQCKQRQVCPPGLMSGCLISVRFQVRTSNFMCNSRKKVSLSSCCHFVVVRCCVSCAIVLSIRWHSVLSFALVQCRSKYDYKPYLSLVAPYVKEEFYMHVP